MNNSNPLDQYYEQVKGGHEYPKQFPSAIDPLKAHRDIRAPAVPMDFYIEQMDESDKFYLTNFHRNKIWGDEYPTKN
jgi:hypothetical protein